MDRDIFTTYEDGMFAQPDLLEHNYEDGMQLVSRINSGELSGDDMQEHVRSFLETHSQVIGTQSVAAARLSLYNELGALSAYEVAERLEHLINEAVERGRRIIQIDQDAAAMFDNLN